MPEDFEENIVIKAMVELEGMSFEEAKLANEQRKQLPTSAFCGPNRTHPCHDENSIRDTVAKLMKLKPKGWEAILQRVNIRATKMGIGFGESKIFKWFVGHHKCEECEK